MDQVDENQNFTHVTTSLAKDFMLSQHEALRRATLLKHRKVSTQLKLDMVQRQLTTLRRSTTDSDQNKQFYRLQMTELSNELQDIGTSLDKVERTAFYAKKRMLRKCGSDFETSATIPLSSSHPAIYSSTENLSRSASRSSLKSRVSNLLSTPTSKFKKRQFFGELRSAASLSSLNIKSSTPSPFDENPRFKHCKPTWKTPLRFLGNLVDIRKKFFVSASRNKSEGNILDDRNYMESNNRTASEDVFGSGSSSESENSEDENEESEEELRKSVPRYAIKAPVMKRISSQSKCQVDPGVLAEIEDFEKMAAQYIKQHS